MNHRAVDRYYDIIAVNIIQSEVEGERTVLPLTIANNRYVSHIGQQAPQQDYCETVPADEVVHVSTYEEDADTGGDVDVEAVLHYQTNLTYKRITIAIVSPVVAHTKPQ